MDNIYSSIIMFFHANNCKPTFSLPMKKLIFCYAPALTLRVVLVEHINLYL